MIPIIRKASALGVGGAIVLLVVVYGISVLLWAWILMLAVGAAGLDWSYGACIAPWGLLMPLVLG